MTITLTWPQVVFAASVGVMRQIEALKRRRPDRHGCNPEDGWSYHIEGACGEMAAARALGVFWSASVNTFKTGGDVGRLQVRTRSNRTYELLIREDDSDHDNFVLVRGLVPTFEVVGWMPGNLAKRPEWLKQHGGREAAYFVPDRELRPLEMLTAWAGIDPQTVEA